MIGSGDDVFVDVLDVLVLHAIYFCSDEHAFQPGLFSTNLK